MASCAHDPSLAGKSLAQITDERGMTPDFNYAAEVAISIQTAGGCSAIYHAADEADLEAILRNPFTMIGSDGGIPAFGEGVPHPRNYGTFARVLGRYVRELRVIDLELAIRKMTSFPAGRLNLPDRGVLRPGMRADLAVFDSEKVTDRATFSSPHQYSEGVVHVFVNGKPALLGGRMTGERSGQILFGPARK
jgi:dihydroorotase/N-acyl-D-amino-acid deacylase